MANRSGHRIAKLHDRLARGESVVMDGGMGTGLQAMGVPMDGEAWSGVANLTHANAVRELHAAYLAAGAEILIANTFATGPRTAQRRGLWQPIRGGEPKRRRRSGAGSRGCRTG
jgi:S-methylmethionine-dependent homocysteine/selenocysteine methylase